MNAKQAIAAAAAGSRIPGAGPWILLAGLGIAGLIYLFSDETETQPEVAPVTVLPPNPPLPDSVISSRNTAENRDIPLDSAGKLVVPVIVHPVPVFEELPPPLPSKRPTILREDLEYIFRDGRTLYRKQAVVELQNRGFGKTAAYEALSENGRFATWLQIAPDGIISWKM